MDTLLVKLQAASLRPLLQDLFKHFGYHCATHQIRVILISCVVITSLLYPALALYGTSGRLSTLSSSLLNVFPTDSQSPHLRDLHDVWSGHEALHLRYDATAKARCGLERTVRVERLLIANNRRHENGVLNKDTLRLTLELEAEIATRLISSTGVLPCVQTQSGGCLFTSPLSFWNHDPTLLAHDHDIIGTLNLSRNVTIAGFPVTLPMVVAGRASLDDMEYVEIGTFLVLTYFFRDDDCHSKSGHNSWIQLVNSVMEGRGHAETINAQSKLLAIQFDAHHMTISPISVLLYMTYLMVFIHFSGSMRRMNTVHSRFGIAFTGIVEIMVSTITSVSVCAIWGFRVTMVPWGILPIVIVFIGAENMFRLVDAVVSTSIQCPVKERIALGLSEAGASNTLKVVTCNAALGIIAVFAPGAIRQFCVFAVVVLVAHWFLVHTFFVAVLSIDLQRLELHELLRQGRSERKDLLNRNAPASPLDSRSPKETMGLLTQLIQGRAARNGSLLMMLAITAVLYSMTYSAVPSNSTRAPYTVDKVVALRKAGVHSPSWQLWQALNPSDDPLVHMRVEAPSLLFLGQQSSLHEAHAFYDKHLLSRAARVSKQLLTIFILPIVTTTTLLWMLLIYLLKDTDSREEEAQHHEHARQESAQAILQNNLRFFTIPRACGADIERVDATPNGTSIIATSLENEVAIWSQQSHSYFQASTLGIDDQGSFVTAVAIDSSGFFSAVGTRTGVIALWRLDKSSIVERRLLRHPLRPSRVIDIAIEDKPARMGDRPTMLHRRSHSGDLRTTDGFLLATFKDGTVVEWNDLYDPKPVVIVDDNHGSARPIIIRSSVHDALMFATIADDGWMRLYTRNAAGWQDHPAISAGSSFDPIIKIHARRLKVELVWHIVVATATKSGQVTLWDGTTGDRWFTLDESIEDITRLRLAPVPPRSCPACGEPSPDTFTLTISAGTIAAVHRFAIEDATRCSCLLLQPPSVSNLLRSRQGSLSSLAPPQHRSRLPSLSNIPAPTPSMVEFPVSAHGVHSRRGSERDIPRRAESGFYLGDDGNAPGNDLPDCAGPPLNHTRLAEVSFQEGAWDTLGHLIYGLRRSLELETLEEDPSDDHPDSETQSPEKWTSQFEGLERPVLERWKLWIFDPSSPELSVKESTLAALASKSTEANGITQKTQHGLHNRNLKARVSISLPPLYTTGSYATPSSFPRLPFTEVSSLLSIGQGSCLIAFGNTIGLVTFTPDDPLCLARASHSRVSSTTIPASASVLMKKRI